MSKHQTTDLQHSFFSFPPETAGPATVCTGGTYSAVRTCSEVRTYSASRDVNSASHAAVGHARGVGAAHAAAGAAAHAAAQGDGGEGGRVSERQGGGIEVQVFGEELFNGH